MFVVIAIAAGAARTLRARETSIVLELGLRWTIVLIGLFGQNPLVGGPPVEILKLATLAGEVAIAVLRPMRRGASALVGALPLANGAAAAADDLTDRKPAVDKFLGSPFSGMSAQARDNAQDARQASQDDLNATNALWPARMDSHDLRDDALQCIAEDFRTRLEPHKRVTAKTALICGERPNVALDLSGASGSVRSLQQSIGDPVASRTQLCAAD